MTSQPRLNLYERNIVEALIRHYQFDPDEARSLVIDYIQVIRKLGGYDNPEDHAERLVQARNTGYSPQEWLERISAIEREERQDKGIPEREKGPEYAHL